MTERFRDLSNGYVWVGHDVVLGIPEDTTALYARYEYDSLGGYEFHDQHSGERTPEYRAHLDGYVKDIELVRRFFKAQKEYMKVLEDLQAEIKKNNEASE